MSDIFPIDDVDGAKVPIRYKLNRPGLFVLIINQRFGYTDPIPDERGGAIKWGHLNYSDEERIWRKLKPPKHQIIVGRDLIPKPGPDDLPKEKAKEDYYEDFLKRVKSQIEKIKPSFVVVYVASHGDEDGNFLLASHQKLNATTKNLEPDDKMCSGVCVPPRKATECRCKVQCHCDDAIPLPQHRCKTLAEPEAKTNFKVCHKRNLDILVTEIQNIVDSSGKKVLSGVPKVFIAQMCRGEKKDGGQKKYLDSKNNGKKGTAVYTVTDADTLRLYSTLAGHVSYVDNGCSLLLKKLYKVLREFHSDIPRDDSKNIKHISKNEMKKLKNRINKSRFSLEKKLSTDRWFVEVEDVVHGWITDVFTRVCNELGLRMGILEGNPHTSAVPSRLDKQVPEYHSSLTLKLSALEMFRDGYADI